MTSHSVPPELQAYARDRGFKLEKVSHGWYGRAWKLTAPDGAEYFRGIGSGSEQDMESLQKTIDREKARLEQSL